MTIEKKQADPVTQEYSVPVSLVLEEIPLVDLKPHPRNYQEHPEDEIEHLVASIRENGIYKNIVTAHDLTILAGHGVVEAAGIVGYTSVPIKRTNLDPFDPRALKLLAGDNEISHLAAKDDRLLSELLRELKDSEVGLLGTGYDDMMLANLVMVTRPQSEIEDLDAAAQWVGMPEYDMGPGQIQVTVHFLNTNDRLEFFRRLDFDTNKVETSKSLWWPERKDDDKITVRFTDTRERDGYE